MEGIKLADICNIEIKEMTKKSKSKEKVDVKVYEIPEKQVKKKKKKLKNILKSRDNTSDGNMDVDDKIFDCLKLHIRSDDIINDVIDCMDLLKISSEPKNKLLLMYELNSFIENISRDYIKLNIICKENKVEISINKNRYLSNVEINLIKTYIQSESFFFNSERYVLARHKEKELDLYIETPLVIASGVIVCQHCGENKTYSWQKQIKRSDEPMTTFYHCVSCGKGGKFS